MADILRHFFENETKMKIPHGTTWKQEWLVMLESKTIMKKMNSLAVL